MNELALFRLSYCFMKFSLENTPGNSIFGRQTFLMPSLYLLLFALLLAVSPACSSSADHSAATSEVSAKGDTQATYEARECRLVDQGFGPEGNTSFQLETVVSGLDVPWGMAFLPNGDLLVTERPGRLRLGRDISGTAQLHPEPIATVEIGRTSEGGLLGLALHPQFSNNRLFYMYVTANEGGRAVNRIERWRLSDDGLQAERQGIIFNGIEGQRVIQHEVYLQNDQGRLREVMMGPDGALYLTTSNCDGRGNCPPERDKILRISGSP